MRFKGLDLNLLVALDVLLDTRNVSRAAEQLHLSQPAVSAALARLRTFFNDPMLIPHGKRMIPTAHALRIEPLLKALLADADAMIATSAGFDPATATRVFKVGTSDYITAVVFAPLLRRIAIEAPGIGVELTPPSDVILPMLESGEIDLLVTPAEHTSQSHPTELLFEERHVVAGWAENPVFARGLTREDFTNAGHVAVEIGRLFRASFGEVNLRLAGITRRIEVMVSSFTMIPGLLVDTPRLAIMHERLAIDAARHYDIAFAPLPFDFAIMREMVQFHRARADDPGLRWLISELHAMQAHNKPI